MPDPGGHEFHVEMHVPALPERATADIVFPAWAPGSYLVRDFVRHVYRLTITDDRGYPLPHERLDKQRWRVVQRRPRLPRALPRVRVRAERAHVVPRTAATATGTAPACSSSSTAS